jgi:hypothetical protein
MMHYDKLKRLEKNYSDFLKKQPYFENTKVELNEDGKWALWICYRKGMSPTTKKEIATELGDIQLKFFMIDGETQK